MMEDELTVREEGERVGERERDCLRVPCSLSQPSPTE